MSLTYTPRQTVVNGSGRPYAGARAWFYRAGTTTAQSVYSDSARVTPHTNPVVANAAGRFPQIYLSPAYDYRCIVKDSGGNTLFDDDNIPSGVLATYPRTDAEASVTLTDQAYPPCNVLRYGSNSEPGTTDMAAALAAANTVAVASGLSITIPEVIHVASATTVTAPLTDTLSQMFSATSNVTLSGCPFVRPEWWGTGQNTVRYAVNSLPSTGGIVQLEDATYQPNGYEYGFASTGVYISKDNVHIRGRKMPRLSNDCSNLEGGSIIQGMVLAYANNFQMSDLGVDSGLDVVATYYDATTEAGVTEALNISYPDDATKALAGLKYGVRLHNVIGLCADADALNHAIIAGEGVGEVVCTGELVGCYGVHGIVIKCAGVRAATLTAYCNDGEGVIIKSDSQATAQVADVMIDKIYTRAQGPIGWSPHDTALSTQQYGVLIQASGASTDKVQIGQILSTGAQIGIGNAFGGSYQSSSVKIGDAIIDQAGVSGTRVGLKLLGTSPQNVQRWSIGRLEVRNSTIGAQFAFDQVVSTTSHCHIEHLHVVAAAKAVDIGGASYVSIGTVTTDTLTAGVYRFTGTPKLMVGILFQDTATTVTYDSTSSGLVPALANGWANVASNDPFGVDLLGGRICLRGLVAPGSTSTITTLPLWARPMTPKRFIVQGSNGTQAAVPLNIGTDGTVVVNEIAGGTTNCSTWLSLSGVTYDAQA
jgi:hypothetical protein